MIDSILSPGSVIIEAFVMQFTLKKRKRAGTYAFFTQAPARSPQAASA
jgi:hypothetical protein